MAINKEQEERYSRNILIKDIGISGQNKLLNSKVLVIGAGGLGSPAALYLTAAGIGTIGIVDVDKVALSNLQRQIIYNTKDLGREKVLSAREKLLDLNPDINVRVYREWVSPSNMASIVSDLNYDFILDCTDNIESKLLINDFCVQFNKPFSHASVAEFRGQILTYLPGSGATCYRCIVGSPQHDTPMITGAKNGIIGAVAGAVGSLQAAETVKYLTGVGELLVNHLLVLNFKTMEFLKIEIHPYSECPICAKKK